MSEFADRVEAICNEIAAELGIHLEGGGPYSSALNSVIRKAQGFGECRSDPNFQIDYWEVCRALSRAFDADENSDAGFWDVVVALKEVYPQFDWHNAMTDEVPPACRCPAGLGTFDSDCGRPGCHHPKNWHRFVEWGATFTSGCQGYVVESTGPAPFVSYEPPHPERPGGY